MIVSRRFLVAVFLVVVSGLLDDAAAFSPLSIRRPSSWRRQVASSVIRSSTNDDFASFAASLEDDDDDSPSGENESTTATATAAPPPKKNGTTKKQSPSWQADIDELLAIQTPPSRRQVLLRDLLNANQEIRDAVLTALRERNIDPLLTPRSKKIQDGTRAVARQLSSDILPTLTSGRQRSAPSLQSVIPPPEDVTRVGARIFNALTNQVQKNIQTLQGDLQDPSRIPQRISRQTSDIVKEATNVFSETPIGLKEPPYTVVETAADYEIRDYEAYKVAATNMAPLGETYEIDNVAQSGAAFNSLAAYLFGANQESKSMSMTTPVTTTMTGEMRFYLAPDSPSSFDDFFPPDPLKQDEAKSVYETGSISIQEIPAARLAVRRFTGFCTSGEIARQKETLLAALELDDVEIDVPHGQTVGHIVFQYNPPYTLPVIRRNEIAVPIARDPPADSAEAWESAPSD